jgi:hypothetical protein
MVPRSRIADAMQGVSSEGVGGRLVPRGVKLSGRMRGTPVIQKRSRDEALRTRPTTGRVQARNAGFRIA